MGMKVSSNITGWTPTAVGNTTNLTDAGHHTVQGYAAPGIVQILEIYMGGEATSSTVNEMEVARDSTVGVTLSLGTGGYKAALSPNYTIQAAPFNTSTTKPQKSATLHLLSLAFNAFGGVVRWVAAPGEELIMVGATASMGEISLTSAVGAGKLSSTIIHEEL